MANLCDSSHWTDILNIQHTPRRHSIRRCEYIGQREWYRRGTTVIKWFRNGRISLSRWHLFYEKGMSLLTHSHRRQIVYHTCHKSFNSRLITLNQTFVLFPSTEPYTPPKLITLFSICFLPFFSYILSFYFCSTSYRVIFTPIHNKTSD